MNSSKSSILWGNDEQPIITKNFSRLVVAFNSAIVKKEIIGVVSPHGVGFKYALKAFAKKHYLKVVYANARHNESIREIFLEVVKDLSNIRFSNLNYRNTTVLDLTRTLNSRLDEGDNALLCIDTYCSLKPNQLKYFIRFLKDYNRPIGLVFRINETHMKRIARSKTFGDSYLQLQDVVTNWRVLDPPSEEEIKSIINFYGITDQIVADDLYRYCKRNLSMLKSGIDRVNKIMHE